MDWNDETIGRLRQLWSEGHSTAEIGRRMGVSKNAVVGKAHRLELAARPSPIRRDGGGLSRPRATVPRRVTGPTLPPLSGLSALGPQPAHAPVAAGPAPHAAAAAPAAPRPAPVAAEAPALRAVATRSSRSVACCWPIGEPGTKTFRFCDAEAASGKPYCTEHAQIAYVKVRDRREEAA